MAGDRTGWLAVAINMLACMAVLAAAWLPKTASLEWRFALVLIVLCLLLTGTTLGGFSWRTRSGKVALVFGLVLLVILLFPATLSL